MMRDLLNQMRQQAGNAFSGFATVRTGIVDAFNSDFTCVVRLEPEDNDDPASSLSQTFPIAALSVGNGFGLLAAPNIGDRVTVHYVEGYNNVGFVLGGLYNNVDVAPSINAGEIYLIHQSGSFIKLMSTGNLSINGHTQINVTAPVLNINTTQTINLTATNSVTIQAPTINLDGDVVLNGNLTTNSGNTTIVNGVLTTNADIITTQDVQASGVSLKTHVHSGVTTGGSNTGAPV